LQSLYRGEESSEYIRVGITCSKKLGGAVIRNRAKRRLKHLATINLPLYGRPHWDYVLIGFKDKTVTRNYKAMTNDLKWALQKIHSTE